jgi:hypothetical protein
MLLGFCLVSVALVSCEKTSSVGIKIVEDQVGQARSAYRHDVRMHYNNRRFDDLEREAKAARDSKEEFTEGTWKLTDFYESQDCRDEEPENMWQLHDTIHQEWIKAKPDSITARVSYARFLTSYAWHARGSGYANTVTQDGWKKFEDRLAKAHDILMASRDLPEKDPMWWQAAMKIALGQGWEKQDYDTLTAEAIAFEPGYMPFYTSRAYSLLPRWYGEPGDSVAFAKACAAKDPVNGPIIYARVCISLRSRGEDLYQEAEASWRDFNAGLEALVKRYPDSLEILSYAALVSCEADDAKSADGYFKKLGGRCMLSIWDDEAKFAAAREWAAHEARR